MFYNRNRHVGLQIRHERHEPQEFTRFIMHTHTTAELFYFVAGKAIYHIEGSSYELQPGDILLMRPSEAHYIEQDPTLPYERICLNFETTLFSSLDPDNSMMRPYYDREPGKRNHYRLSREENAQCRSYLDNILKADNRLMAVANLILLMNVVGKAFDRNSTGNTQPDSLEYQIIRYINRNLEKELTIEELCNRFFISRAQLCRRFKKITGTSVGKYVTAKRLIAAQNLLRQGRKPMEVYAACGYQDYSTFYRAYLQYFGYSPRDLSQINESSGDRMEFI